MSHCTRSCQSEEKYLTPIGLGFGSISQGYDMNRAMQLRLAGKGGLVVRCSETDVSIVSPICQLKEGNESKQIWP